MFIPFSVMLLERLNETCPKIRLFNNQVGVEMILTQVTYNTCASNSFRFENFWTISSCLASRVMLTACKINFWLNFQTARDFLPCLKLRRF